MTKQAFLNLCAAVFERYGFSRHKRHYYLDDGTDILGAILFQGSSYGGAFYLNCGFSIKNENPHLPYPNIYQVNMSMRIVVPGRSKGPYLKEGYKTEMIRYEKYTIEEMETFLVQELEAWVMPAIQNGLDFILANEETYGRMVREARQLGKM